MKNQFYVFIGCVVFFACNQGQESWETKKPSAYQLKVQKHQDSMNMLLLSGQNGVLEVEQLANAKPISYFSVDENYKIEARFERIYGGKEFEMKTSTERLPIYRPFGILHFDLDGQAQQLHLYQNKEYPDYLFCPFKDLTNGKESYGAGRYLDFEMKDTLSPVIDFNYSYNPYCAYNHKYSCPIPPQENHLSVKVNAGVKKWH